MKDDERKAFDKACKRWIGQTDVKKNLDLVLFWSCAIEYIESSHTAEMDKAVDLAREGMERLACFSGVDTGGVAWDGSDSDFIVRVSDFLSTKKPHENVCKNCGGEGIDIIQSGREVLKVHCTSCGGTGEFTPKESTP